MLTARVNDNQGADGKPVVDVKACVRRPFESRVRRVLVHASLLLQRSQPAACGAGRGEAWRDRVRASGSGGTQVGDVVAGTVTRVQPYGVFVALGGGMQGLLYVANISQARACARERRGPFAWAPR